MANNFARKTPARILNEMPVLLVVFLQKIESYAHRYGYLPCGSEAQKLLNPAVSGQPLYKIYARLESYELIEKHEKNWHLTPLGREVLWLAHQLSLIGSPLEKNTSDKYAQRGAYPRREQRVLRVGKTCLRCKKQFNPSFKYNFICSSCRALNERTVGDSHFFGRLR